MKAFKTGCQAFLLCFCVFLISSQIAEAADQRNLVGESIYDSDNLDHESRTVNESNSKRFFYSYRLRNHFANDFLERLKDIAESQMVPETFRGELKQSLDSCLIEKEINSLVFVGKPQTLDRVEKLVVALDVPAGQVGFQILIFKTSIDNVNAFGVEGITNFISENNTDVFLGTSINYQGRSLSDLSELAQILFDDSKTEILSFNTIPCKEYSKAAISQKTLYKLEKGLLANVPESVILNEDQSFEAGLSLYLTPKIYEDWRVDLHICLENIAPNLNSKAFQAVDLKENNLSHLFITKQAMTTVSVPNGFFAVFPSLVIEEKEEEDILQVPCLGGIALCGGGNKHRGIREQQSIMLILRPVIFDMGEKPQLENLFDQ